MNFVGWYFLKVAWQSPSVFNFHREFNHK